MDPEPLTRCALTRADFETVLAALEPTTGGGARDDAQDVLQLRASRRWLEDLETDDDQHR